MTDLQSDAGAGGSSNGTVQVEMFGTAGVERKRAAEGPKRRPAYGNGLKAPSPIGKNFVLDTNVLLHDPECLERFGDNHLCIPLEVLCELDKFKNEQSERGASARTVHRKLAALFSSHPEHATTGIPNREGGSIRLVPAQSAAGTKSVVVEELMAVFHGQESNDNRILICTQLIAEKNTAPTILVTKDLNLQLKAHAIGIPCEDYQNDKVDSAQVGAGQLIVDLKPNDLQRFASAGSLELPPHVKRISPNEYVLLKAGEKRTIPARMGTDGVFHKLQIPDQIRIQRGAPLRPLNLGQQCFLDALLNPEVTLVTCYGQAGTGKTLLAVAAALHLTFNGDYNGVTVSRPVIPMGDTLGFLPGSLEEKLDPWLKPIFDALEFILAPEQGNAKRKQQARPRKGGTEPFPATGGKRSYDPFLESGLIEVEALCYIRGRSIPNRFFILDEAQQLTPLEAKTIVTRMAKGSKLVLVGDPAQIDNPYVDRLSNGLVYTRDRLRDESCSSHVTLERGERSQLAEAAARKM
ncbi:MAG TPA: PhoH family protein [Verrucomicrobiales bacterium]|nr:PhoH family protein [Verrucomicrobiales bacterium]